MPDHQAVTLTPREISFVASKYWTNDREREIAVAVALAESQGNMYAHNAVPPDDSYGLWQINMRGNLGPDRRQKYGLSSNDDLYIPDINARVAYGIFKDSSNTFNPWTTWKTGAIMKYMSQAADAAQNPEDPAQIFKDLGLDPGKVSTFQDPITAAISGIIDQIVTLLKPFFLRLAGFVGGAALIGGGIMIYLKKVK